jgi:hypothetical protein
LDKRHSGPGQVYLFISGMTVLLAFCFAVLYANPAATLIFLVVGLTIAYLVERLGLMDEKLLALRIALLRMAFEECYCGSKSHCHCHVCQARAVLKNQFPGAIETEIRERLGEYRDDNGRWILNNLPFRDPWLASGPIPKDLDLTTYLSPVELDWHRAYGQLPEAH